MSDTRSGAPNRNAGKEMVSASAMGETGTVVDSGYEKNSLVSLVRLVQAQTGGREEVAGPWCALNARAEVLTNRYFSEPLPPGSYGPPRPIPITGRFQAFTSYGSQTDTRGVIITSPTIEDSFHKGPTEDSMGRPQSGQELNQRKDDGSIATDSAVYWSSIGAEWAGDGTFNAVINGFTNPSYKWSVEGDGVAGGFLYNQSTLDLTGSGDIRFGAGDSGFPKNSNISVEVTDGPGTDGAKGSNTFKVKWHLPDEWESAPYRVDPPTWDSAEPVELGPRTIAYTTGSVEGKWRWKNFYIGALTEAGQVILDLSSSMPSDPYSKLFYKAAGIAWERQMSEHTTPLDASFQAVWDSGLNNNPSAAASWEGGRPADNSDSTKSMYYLTNPRMVVEYKIHYYQGDKYDTHGFAGIQRKPAKKWTGGVHITGDFFLNIQEPGS